jgi:hypothetical protein
MTFRFEHEVRSGDRELKLTELGLSAELQAALAIGAQLDVKGEVAWSKNKHQVKVGGEASAFIGAEAKLKLKLSTSAIEGLEAKIEAGAFAGFKASVKGSCAYSYDGQ